MKSRSPVLFMTMLLMPIIDCGAAQPPHTATDSELSTVRELMRADAALALRQANERLASQGIEPPVPGKAPGVQGPPPRLLAIYGVGRKLLAHIQVGKDPVLYMRGKPTPVGRSTDPEAYHLKGMDGSCVQLERRGEAYTLCLQALGLPGR